ncbi:MAG TPA: C39 family peptidase [Chloroflexota bacterium]|nr:C39 family peptidase [Chloroflexota bacterium]
MRRLLPFAMALALATSACASLAQQDDVLAPHVGSAPPAAALTSSPSPASQPAGSESQAQAPDTAAAASSPSGAAADGAGVGAPESAAANASPAAAPAAAPSPAQSPATTLVTGVAPVGIGAPAALAPAASSVPVPAASVPSAPPVAIAPTAARTLLNPMQHEYETWNNCAPVTSEMVLSYYGINKRQTEIAAVLKPNPKNLDLRIDQIQGYVEQFGLEAQPLVNGTFAQLKALISNGIPVVTEDQLSLQDDYGHFRVARGYDDAAGVIIFGDSYYGPQNRITYALYQELWKRHNYAFMPVYKPAQRPLVQAILGKDFDPGQNVQAAVADAKQAVAQHADDGFAWLDLGDDLYAAGQLQDARTAWEKAKTMKLTPRTLWYTIWPAAVYNQLGMYQDALNVVAIPLATDPDNAQALLERGNANKGLGKTAQAKSDYTSAITIDPSLAPARLALQGLSGAGG